MKIGCAVRGRAAGAAVSLFDFSEVNMHSKTTLIAMALAGTFAWSGASLADQGMVKDPYPGWGPMANLETPYSPNEAAAPQYDSDMLARAQHVAEVREARESVWLANASRREGYEVTEVADGRSDMLLDPFRRMARFFSSHFGGRE